MQYVNVQYIYKEYLQMMPEFNLASSHCIHNELY